MRTKKSYEFFVILVFFILFSFVVESGVISQANLSIKLDENSGNIKQGKVLINGEILPILGGGIIFRDKNDNVIKANIKKNKKQHEKIVTECSYTFGKCLTEITSDDTAIRFHFKVENSTDKVQMIIISFDLILNKNNLLVYNGKETLSNLNKTKNFNRWGGTTDSEERIPLNCIYNKNVGIASGISADEKHSECIPEIRINDNGTITVSQTIRITLYENNGQYEGTFVLIPFSPKYKERDGIARYHSLYPKRFKKNKDIDPRIHGIPATYLAWRMKDAEACRISGADWEWCYSPNRRNGDIADSKENYDYKPYRPFGKFYKVSREQFIARQKTRMNTGKWCNVAMMFYTLGHNTVDSKLADKFPDSKITTGSHCWRSVWGVPHDDAQTVFTYKTGYGDFFRKGIKEVFKRHDVISGLAIDAPYGIVRYRGSALKKIENVSWDNLGPYVASAVANAHIYEYVRTFEKNGYKMGIINNINELGHYLDAFFADSAMIEKPAYHYKFPFGEQHRYCFGEKGLCWWEEYDLSALIDISKTSKEDIIDAIRGLADYTCLASIQWGITYSHTFSGGVEYLIRMLPVMKALNNAGWRPVIGFQSQNKNLWLSRYGEGFNSFVCVGNPTGKLVKDTLTIYMDELFRYTLPIKQEKCSENLVFVEFFGHKTENILNGRTNRINYDILSRKNRVFRAVMELDENASGKADIWQEKSYNQTTISANISGKINTIKLPLQGENKHLSKVMINDKPVKFTTSDSIAIVKCEGIGEFFLKVLYKSTRTNLKESELTEFKFLNKNLKTTFNIYCAEDTETEFLTKRFLEFFRHYISSKKGMSNYKLPVKIQKLAELPKYTIVILNENGKLSSFDKFMVRKIPFITGKPDKGILVMSGKSFNDLQKIVYDYMDILSDTSYRDYIGKVYKKKAESIYLLPEEKGLFK